MRCPMMKDPRSENERQMAPWGDVGGIPLVPLPAMFCAFLLGLLVGSIMTGMKAMHGSMMRGGGMRGGMMHGRGMHPMMMMRGGMEGCCGPKVGHRGQHHHHGHYRDNGPAQNVAENADQPEA
jgi:hypothetical protein